MSRLVWPWQMTASLLYCRTCWFPRDGCDCRDPEPTDELVTLEWLTPDE